MRGSQDSDIFRIRHMLLAAEKIVQLSTCVDRKSFDNDETLQLALQHLVQIIGEAAYKVSADAKVKHHRIPWALITGMRHHLVHAYFDVDLDVLWVAARENVPQLINQLEKILEEEIG